MTALDKAFIRVYSRDEPHPRVPSPHFKKQPKVAAQQEVAEARQALGAPHSLGIYNARAEEDAPPSITKIPLTPAAPLRPAFEVDRVVWPQICGTLSSELGHELDAFLGEFAPRDAGGSRILGLAGTSRGAGSTTIALTLARQLCQHKPRKQQGELLLIDADLQSSELARQLGLALQACWCENASQQGALADSLVESLHDKLVVMSISNGRSHTSKQVNRHKLRCDLQILAGCYRTIVVDFGPIKAANEGGMLAALGGCVESLLLVHDQRNAEELEQAILLAEQSELDIAGVIENFSVDSIRPVMVA
jgi:Mrp family chromosome partitioning ATPase